jgi:hypothetical protein
MKVPPKSIKYKHYNIELAYILCVISAFAMLFFANAEAQETPDGSVVELGIGKLFYIPCMFAFILSLFLNPKADTAESRMVEETNPIIYKMILICIISVLFNLPQNFNTMAMNAIKFIAAIMCFKDLRIINPRLFILILTAISPAIIIPHYFLTNPFAYGAIRYGGFYGDPNFLAIALNFLITMCYLGYKATGRLFIKAASVVSIIGAIPLILLGVSRAGIIGMCVVLFFILRDLRRVNSKMLTLILILLFFSAGRMLYDLADAFDYVRLRFSNEGDNDSEGAYARVEVMRSVINVLRNRPEHILFGIGPGNTMERIQEYRMFGYTFTGVVHNTFFLVLYEMGIFCMLLFIKLYYVALRNLLRDKSFLLLGLLLSVAFCLATLPGLTFMPAWILLFFLMNPRLFTQING